MYNVILIGCQSYGTADRALGLDALAGSLSCHAAVDVTSLDSARMTMRKVKEILFRTRPDVVGISVRPGGVVPMRSLIEFCRTLTPAPKVVLGGQTVTVSADLILSEFPDVVAVVGEGEEALVRLVNRWSSRSREPYEEIPNIAFMRDAEYVATKRRVVPERYIRYSNDQASLAIENGGVVWVESSRSCSSHCTFCIVGESHMRTPRRSLSENGLYRQLAALSALGATSVSLADFNALETIEDAERLSNVLQDFRPSMQFRLDVRADGIWNPQDSELDSRRRLAAWKLLRGVGVVQVFIGFESASDEQLKRFAKSSTFSDQQRALARLDECDIDYVLGYIGLDPFSTLEEIHRSVSQLVLNGLLYHITSPLKEMRVQRGTPYMRMAEMSGLVGRLQDNLMFYDYAYADPRVEALAPILRFFHYTTAKIYHHSYLTNMLRAEAMKNRIVKPMENLARKFKDVEATFLLNLLEESIYPAAGRGIPYWVKWFARTRLAVFTSVCDLYKNVLSGEEGGHFVIEMETFCSRMLRPADHFLLLDRVEDVINAGVDIGRL